MAASRLPACLLLFATVIGSTGCGPAIESPQPPTAELTASEPIWSAQLADVRAGRSRRIVVARLSVTAAQFSELEDGCAALEVLDLEAVAADADSLAVLAHLPRLKRIKLGAPVDDAGLEHLIQATELTAVNLPAGTFTDRGLELLATLPQLELLRFHSPNVSDDGMQHVARMPTLRFLHLIDVPVTDAGLAHLHGMRRLESLYLDGGRVTEPGLRALLAALPELHFHLDQLHLPGDPRADAHAETEPAAP